MFWSAEQLYDLKFTENTGKVPVFHPDVRTFEVTNAKTGDVIGLFYLDTYAPRGQAVGRLGDHLPRAARACSATTIVLVSNNNNFTKPAAGQPVLISLDDASTLFHEFGHAIHYSADRRQLPVARRVAARLRRISEPGERELAADPAGARASSPRTTRPASRCRRRWSTRSRRPETFNQGFATVEYLSSALVDMKLHTRPRRRRRCRTRSRRRRWPRSACRREMVMRHRLPQFGHLFSSDSYSAGYYSYLWSETMDADTWAAFEDGRPVQPDDRRPLPDLSCCRPATRPTAPRPIARSAAAIRT